MSDPLHIDCPVCDDNPPRPVPSSDRCEHCREPLRGLGFRGRDLLCLGCQVYHHHA